MADNPQVRAGTAGGTITVAADEITSPYSGDTAQAQAVKILDGSVNGTTPAKVTSSGELVTFVGNQGTVTVGGTAAVLVGGGTVVVSSSDLPVGAATLAEQQTQSASLSVLDDWDESDRAKVNPIAGQAGVQGGAGAANALTQRVTVATDDIVKTAGTVVVSSAPTTTVEATNLDIRDLTSASDSVAAAQSGAWNVGGTVQVAGTVPVSGNIGGTVSVAGTVPVTGPVTQSGAWNVGGTVNAVQSGAWNVGGTITKGSAVMGLGYVLGGTQITLTASGTVIAAVASKTIYVTHEAFTVQGGTVTITARNGNGGGTLWGPMQFSPTGGMAVSAPLEQGGLYQSVSGSAVYYELSGSGTVGGRIRWAVA